jgi:hypothetical protein
MLALGDGIPGLCSGRKLPWRATFPVRCPGELEGPKGPSAKGILARRLYLHPLCVGADYTSCG